MRTDHRPWPVPSKPWVMKQIWHHLLFAHWSVPMESIRALVPSSLPIDTYNGRAWIGIVPFQMSGIRLRGLPPIPYTSKFAEINIRTYVTLDHKPGVYFFSLDAANRLAVFMARRLFHLPYYFARMGVHREGEEIQYLSRRSSEQADFSAKYSPISEVFRSAPGTLEQWLTDRYCLYSHHQDRLYRCDILHEPWPLQHAHAEIKQNTMLSPLGIELPDSLPHLLYANKLEVLIWPLQGLRC